jgi:4-amino-4-deoxy-L-arabinose transferase-like glycosyltransferase
MLLRLGLGARVPLVDDEAYYWLWSRHLGWGYPDHPPMIAALLAVATRVAGDSPLVIRALPALLAASIPLLVYLAGRDLFDGSSGLRAAVIVAVLPIITLGTALAFPDGPFGAFWILGLWTGWRALRQGGWWWIAAGVAVGLALMTKLTALFLIMGLGGMVLFDGWRRALRDPGFYAGAALAGLLVAPFLLWNATHDWWTITFTLTRPAWIQPRTIPENLLLFAAGQIGYHGLAALPLVAAVIDAARRPGATWRYLVWMSAPLLLMMFAYGAWAAVKPHWPSPAYFAAAIALGALWPGQTRGRRRLFGAAVAGTAVLTITAAAVVLLPAGFDHLTSSLGRWEEVAQAAGRRSDERLQAGRPVFILTDGYQVASQIAYHLRERIPVTPLRYAFTLWLPPQTLQGHDVVYVNTEGNWMHRVRAHCAGLIRADTLTVAPGVKATLYLCREFREVVP